MNTNNRDILMNLASIQEQVQEETRTPWILVDAYSCPGEHRGLIIWEHKLSIGPDDAEEDELVHVTFKAQSNFSSPNKLYGVNITSNGLEFVNIITGFFG